MNKTGLRIVLALQVLFFAVWGLWEYAKKLNPAAEIYLDTLPDDPRDLLSGQYMALAYKIGQPDNLPGFPKEPSGSFSLCVKLAPGPEVATESGPVKVYQAEAVDIGCGGLGLPGAGGYWVQGQWSSQGWRRQISYGIEKYFFSQARLDEMNKMRSGDFLARVAVGRGGEMTILGLVKKVK